MIFTISGPSGAGKGTLVKKVTESDPKVRLSVSYTTRERKSGEVNGRHYHFVTHEEFEQKFYDGFFVEYAMVLGHYYGTPIHELHQASGGGRDLFLEIDCQGASQIKEKFPRAKSVFILPPSHEELKRRLLVRGREKNSEELAHRLAASFGELAQAPTFDAWILNDDLDQAVEELSAYVAYWRHGGVPDARRFQNQQVLQLVQATFTLGI